MPRRPDQPPGTELRLRTRRDGSTYWVWRVRWKDPATGKKLVEEFHTPEEALDYKAHLRLLKRRGALAELDVGMEPLAAFAQEWLSSWAAQNLDYTTLQTYASVYNNHLLGRVGHLQLRQITPRVVDRLRQELQDDDVGAPTIRKALSILQAMFRQAVMWGRASSNPVQPVTKPKAKRSIAVVPFSVRQIEALLDAFPDPTDRMLAELIAYTGARPQDALAVAWARMGRTHVVYADKNVNGAIVQGAKTGEDKSRSVELLRNVRLDLGALRVELGGAEDDAAIIGPEPWKRSRYQNWRRRQFAKAAAAAGMTGATPYHLRHTYASLRIAEGRLSLKEIADEMGHSLQVLSDTYSHVINEYKGLGKIDPDRLISEARRPQEAPARRKGRKRRT